MNLEIWTVLIALNGSRKQFFLATTSVISTLEVNYNEMRYINLHFSLTLHHCHPGIE